jgi:hypothetical protein
MGKEEFVQFDASNGQRDAFSRSGASNRLLSSAAHIK